jgi:hypothetical protein
LTETLSGRAGGALIVLLRAAGAIEINIVVVARHPVPTSKMDRLARPALVVGDFNGDGIQDIAVTGKLGVWLLTRIQDWLVFNAESENSSGATALRDAARTCGRSHRRFQAIQARPTT